MHVTGWFTPGARLAIVVQLSALKSVSLTVMFVNVTFPVFCTENVYVITSPTALTLVGFAVFVSIIDGVPVKVCVSSSESVTFGPLGGVPVAVAVFVNVPASMLTWVRVYVPVKVVVSLAPGDRLAIGPALIVTPPIVSARVILVNMTLPEFVTVKA